MARAAGRDFAVGAMFALAMLVLALAVMAVGGETGWLFDRVGYFVTFPNTDGLLVGAPVRMAGVQIGTVSGIQLSPDPSDSGIRVDVAVDVAYAPRVREDSRATLRILQLLTNEKFVEILPGSTGSVLAPGSRIERQEETGVLERSQVIAEDLGEITVALKSILGRLEQGDGLLGQMLSDPDFGRKGLDALGRTLENTERLTSDLLAGKGLVGRLLHDEQLAARLDRFSRSVEGLGALVERASAEGGTVDEFLAVDGAGRQALADLSAAAATLRRLLQQVEDDAGLVGRLIGDPQYSAALAEDAQATLANLAEITDKINRGDGTLGALVNERVLYDGAEEVVAGVNDSKFARWLLRHYQKKGVRKLEQRQRGSERGEPAPEGPPPAPPADE